MAVSLERKELLNSQYCHNLNKLSFSDIKSYMAHKVWWACEKGHKWETSIRNRFEKNTNCPYCSGKKVLSGFNDLATTHPALASQWHPTFNVDKLAINYSAGSKEKIWWYNENCQHEWEAVIKNRTISKQNCPICSNKKVVTGINDLATTHPKVTALWDYDKNADTVDPSEITAGSSKKVWWKCEESHTWEAKIYNVTAGTKCPYCSGNKTFTGFNDVKTLSPFLAMQWHPIKNGSLKAENFSLGSEKKVWWLGKCGHEWETKIAHRSYGYGCPVCGKRISLAENELYEFVVTLLSDPIIKNDHSQLEGHELDIFVPSKNIGIEFNGLYWHSEQAGKTRNYHYNKWKNCKDKGIQLIQVWEDDYNRNPELIKRILAHKLGVTQERKVGARKTFIKEINPLTANKFLNDNHIQGAVDGSIRLGLFERKNLLDTETETLVAVMVLKRESGTKGKTLNLLRYATSLNVVGGFTKLLNHIEQTYTPEKIITFSDNTISNGGLYETNGFELVKELAPDYMYIVKGRRIHKFNYRLKKFKEDSSLQYQDGLSERELATLNKILCVWDAGKIKWVKCLI